MYITPRISIQIYGWFDQPQSVLIWSDVKRLQLTWRQLRDNYECTAQQLQLLQPDKLMWINRAGLKLLDLPDMTMFPVNPLTDMRADIGELLHTQWDHETLLAMGVTYEQMVKFGMTPRIMAFFRFSLSAWVALSLEARHTVTWTDADTMPIFGLGHLEIQKILSGD